MEYTWMFMIINIRHFTYRCEYIFIYIMFLYVLYAHNIILN